MRVLYHHRIASKDGQYVHVSEILGAMCRANVEVVVVAPKFTDQQDFGNEAGLVAKLKSSFPKFIYESFELLYSFIDLTKIAYAILRFKPDFIYERYNIYFISGILAAKVFRIPLVLEINAPLFDERKKYNGFGLPWLARWTEEFTWRNADYVLPVTRVLAKRVVATKGVSKSAMQVIANGVSKDFLADELPTKIIPKLRAEQVVVGFVGFCREWHRLDRVIDLLAEPEGKHLFCLIVGDGPVLEDLKKQARSLNVQDQIHFTGLTGRRQMPGWLTAMDIALQPAVVPYASPLKLIEYLATGKAIVAPAQENIRELLEDGVNALLFSEGNIDDFVGKVRLLSRDTELRRKLGAAARQTVSNKRLTWDSNVKRILSVAEELCAASTVKSKL